MSVLTRDVILQEIEAGRLRIEPFDASRVGPASVDLTLADELRVMEDSAAPIPIVEDVDYRRYSHPVPFVGSFLLKPGMTVLGITHERVTLPGDLCAFLGGRSRFARLGLMIHVTAPFLQPGVSNRTVLEISNLSSRILELHAGTPICQLVLMRTEGKAVYAGRFAQQDEV